LRVLGKLGRCAALEASTFKGSRAACEAAPPQLAPANPRGLQVTSEEGGEEAALFGERCSALLDLHAHLSIHEASTTVSHPSESHPSEIMAPVIKLSRR
jgi:hypothetical protein